MMSNNQKQSGKQMGEKEADKNVRQPIGEQDDVNKISDDEKMCMATGRQGILDFSYYTKLPQYEKMAWRLVSDADGDLDKCLDLGMKLTELRKNRTARQQVEKDDRVSEWVRKAVGAIGGVTEFLYLCHMPEDEYHTYFIQPNRDRQALINNAIGMGKTDAVTEGIAQIKGGDIPTYAAKIEEGSYNKII